MCESYHFHGLDSISRLGQSIKMGLHVSSKNLQTTSGCSPQHISTCVYDGSLLLMSTGRHGFEPCSRQQSALQVKVETSFKDRANKGNSVQKFVIFAYQKLKLLNQYFHILQEESICSGGNFQVIPVFMNHIVSPSIGLYLFSHLISLISKRKLI